MGMAEGVRHLDKPCQMEQWTERCPLSSQGTGFVGTQCSAKAAWELPVGGASQMMLMSTIAQEAGISKLTKNFLPLLQAKKHQKRQKKSKSGKSKSQVHFFASAYDPCAHKCPQVNMSQQVPTSPNKFKTAKILKSITVKSIQIQSN
jgi:hypothetical protein